MPLPISLPLPADWMLKCEAKRTLRQRSIVQPAMISHPGGMRSVLIEIARARMVMLVIHHAYAGLVGIEHGAPALGAVRLTAVG